MRKAYSVVVWTLGTMLAASPARGLGDLTGTWEGTLICDSASAAVFDRTKGDFIIHIDDDPSGDAFAQVASPYPLRVIPHPRS